MLALHGVTNFLAIALALIWLRHFFKSLLQKLSLRADLRKYYFNRSFPSSKAFIWLCTGVYFLRHACIAFCKRMQCAIHAFRNAPISCNCGTSTLRGVALILGVPIAGRTHRSSVWELNLRNFISASIKTRLSWSFTAVHPHHVCRGKHDEAQHVV